MSEEIMPAMSAEEWNSRVLDGAGKAYIRAGNVERWENPVDGEFDSVSCNNEYAIDPHSTAALCLYKQPFGFTQADVDALRAVVDAAESEQSAAWSDAHTLPARLAINKIAALLPPAS